MIGTIRKHQNWLWGIIIAATIGTFVVYLTPNQGSGGAGGLFAPKASGVDYGSINGERITSQQFGEAIREATLFYRLRANAWPETEDQRKQVRRLAGQNLVIQSLLKDYKITGTTEAAARMLRELLRVPEGQPVSLESMNKFVETQLKPNGIGWDDVDNFARHQAAQEYLMALFGTSGELVTPKEVEFFYRRENTPMVAEVADFSTSNYLASANPSEADLQDYFTKHEAEYRVPERIVVNYVLFSPTNYTAEADKQMGSNVEERVSEVYRQQGPEAFTNEAGKVMTPTEAQAKIRSELRLSAELNEANLQAHKFLAAMGEGKDDKHPYSPSDLETVAKAKNIPVRTTPPFDERSGTNVLDLPPRAMQVLFAMHDYQPGDPELTNDPGKTALYVLSPLVTRSGAYVVGLSKRIPSQLQPLSAVRDQVVKDFRDAKAETAAKDAAEKFVSAVQVGLAQGKTFDAVCAAQNVKAISLPPFALTTTNLPPGFDRSTFQQLEQTLFQMPVGQVSRLIMTPDGGIVAFLKDRLAVDEAKMSQELPMYVSRMREQREVAAFSEWLGKQMQARYIPAPENN